MFTSRVISTSIAAAISVREKLRRCRTASRKLICRPSAGRQLTAYLLSVHDAHAPSPVNACVRTALHRRGTPACRPVTAAARWPFHPCLRPPQQSASCCRRAFNRLFLYPTHTRCTYIYINTYVTRILRACALSTIIITVGCRIYLPSSRARAASAMRPVPFYRGRLTTSNTSVFPDRPFSF